MSVDTRVDRLRCWSVSGRVWRGRPCSALVDKTEKSISPVRLLLTNSPFLGLFFFFLWVMTQMDNPKGRLTGSGEFYNLPPFIL